MKTSIKFFLAALLLGGIAYSASESLDRVTSAKPQHFLKGVYVGTDQSGVAKDTKNGLKHSGGTRIEFTFSALGNDGGTRSCEWAHIPGYIYGAKMGDPCLMGVGYGNTNPVTSDNNQQANEFYCYVVDAGTTLGTVKIRRCGAQSAGALEDAGFQVRTFSNGL